MGFVKFPNRGYSESELTYFKPLIKTQSTSANKDFANKIELWDTEPYQKDSKQPRWIWNVELCGDKLKLPIIQACDCNWNLKWIKNGKIVKEDKVKYFDSKKNRIDFSPFLYIDKLID